MALTPEKVLAGWKVWGIPALIQLLAPWHKALFGFSLISDYWQPGLNGIASAVGALAAMTAYGFLFDRPRRSQRRAAIISALTLVGALVICIGFNLTVGISWFPPTELEWVVRLVWIVVYLLIFVGSGFLILALLLMGTSREP